MSKVYDWVCPCKECTERQLNCHSICKKYLDWKNSGVEEKVERFGFDILHKRRRARFNKKRF